MTVMSGGLDQHCLRATSVILLVGFDNSKVSARNCFTGRIGFIEKGLVNAEVAVAAHGGKVVAFVTNDSVGRLGLTVGRMATAIFKATSVIIGVD
jgi:molybdopterin-binding protein